MRRPNQFIGLERVKMPNYTEPVLIYPNLLSQINQADPDRAYGDDPVKFAALGGLVAPIDRQLKVTTKISTIVEFQAIDYKMENCELMLTMPSSQEPNSSLKLGSEDNIVNIWLLKESFHLDMKTLSWNTRPVRVRKVDSVSIAFNKNYTYPFHCPLNSLHAFEVSAGNDETFVEWSQDVSNPNPAIVMVQHASA